MPGLAAMLTGPVAFSLRTAARPARPTADRQTPRLRSTDAQLPRAAAPDQGPDPRDLHRGGREPPARPTGRRRPRRPRARRVRAGRHPRRAPHPPGPPREPASRAGCPTQDAPVVVYCAGGIRSAFAAKTLAELGLHRRGLGGRRLQQVEGRGPRLDGAPRSSRPSSATATSATSSCPRSATRAS